MTLKFDIGGFTTKQKKLVRKEIEKIGFWTTTKKELDDDEIYVDAYGNQILQIVTMLSKHIPNWKII